jgi:predicted metal-dependent phosphoesterase TrpH
MNLSLWTLVVPWLAVFPSTAQSHEPVTRARTPIQLPEVPGFVTLKCDFHIHTVFSDGLVWPTLRAEEAWREGLDAIAITDHIEYQPHKADITTNHNRSYEIAKNAGDDLELMVVKGSEITRKMPPGHLNAIFLTNSASLAVAGWQDAIAAAHAQDAFIFWNHPGWESQITNGLVLWYPEHTELLNAGMLHGIEVVNGRDYYPEAHRWAIEKKLAMLSNSDIHTALNLEYHVHDRDHRPITLVFAADRTKPALKQALFARQTAVYSGNRLIGDEKFLRPIFMGSLDIRNSPLKLKKGQRVQVQIHNRSDVDYMLERAGEAAELSFPTQITLPAQKTVLMAITAKTSIQPGQKQVSLPFRVTNLLVGPNRPLSATIDLDVNFNGK